MTLPSSKEISDAVEKKLKNTIDPTISDVQRRLKSIPDLGPIIKNAVNDWISSKGHENEK